VFSRRYEEIPNKTIKVCILLRDGRYPILAVDPKKKELGYSPMAPAIYRFGGRSLRSYGEEQIIIYRGKSKKNEIGGLLFE
jgi:hypothetical protein